MTPFLDELEAQRGAITCWEWTKDWVASERECDDDERMSLEEYLLMRAGEED